MHRVFLYLSTILVIFSLALPSMGQKKLTGRSATQRVAVSALKQGPQTPTGKGTSSSGTQSSTLGAKPPFPAAIQVTEKAFIDSDGDGVLYAEESGRIRLKIVNQSIYPGDVTIKLTPLKPMDHIAFASEKNLGIIKGNEQKTIDLELKADMDVTTAAREIRVDVVENYYRFDAVPIRITFNSQAFEPPKFRIVLREVKDERTANSPLNNNNGQVDKQEVITVIVAVQNIGGDAQDVRATIDLKGAETANIYYRTLEGGTNAVFPLSDLAYGAAKEVAFIFFTNSFYNRPTVDFDVKIEEKRGRFGTVQSFQLPIAGQIKTDEVLVVSGKRKPGTDIQVVEPGLVDVEQVPTNARTRQPNAYAVIIGIEDYKYAPKAQYKVRDAQYFYEYATKVLGIPDENINRPLFNQDATKGEIDYIFTPKSSPADGWLKRRLGDAATAQTKDIYVYLGGHGIADRDNQEPYFLPYDIRPDQANAGISLNQLYKTLDEFGARSVTVFVESCFSGLTGYSQRRENKPDLLVAGQNPGGWRFNPAANLERTLVFAAASGAQASYNYDGYKHGIFTYYLLKGLKGEADANFNRKIELKELWRYLSDNVGSKVSQLLGQNQQPSIFPSTQALEQQGNRVVAEY